MSSSLRPASSPSFSPSAAGPLLLATVVLTGLNLRSFLTAVGPLANDIRRDLALDFQSMAWLTFLPVVLMGVGAFLAPTVGRKLGSRRAVLIALGILAGGSALRYLVPHGLALIGTAALCGLGVAIVQTVLPGIIKEHYSNKIAPVMGLYSAAMMGGGALGAQLSPIVANFAGGWRVSLAWLAAPCALALVAALVALPKERVGLAPRPSVPLAPFLRRPRTWLLMAYFGVVNGGYSSLVAWLAPYYQSHHWDAASSGNLVAVMALSQAVAALTLPALASRNRDRRLWLWIALALQGIGFAGLALLPDAAPRLWAAVAGAGLGGFFALGLVVALDHLPGPAEAAALGAVMQGGGFIIAALSPWMAGLLRETTGSFVAGWWMHVAGVAVAIFMTGRLVPGGYADAMRLPGRTATSRKPAMGGPTGMLSR